MAKNFIYIFTNPSFSKYVKIGSATDPQKRLNDANSSTWTPKAFRLYGTYETAGENADKILHKLIERLDDELRVSDVVKGHERKREFFEMSPEKAWAILDDIATISGTKDRLWKNDKWTTDEMLEDASSTSDDVKTISKATKRFDFEKYGIQLGSTLKFKYDDSIQVRTLIDGNVEYKGEKISLSKLSENLMVERTGKRWKGYQGLAYFTYNGVLLTDIKANFVTAQQSANEVDDEQD